MAATIEELRELALLAREQGDEELETKALERLIEMQGATQNQPTASTQQPTAPVRTGRGIGGNANGRQNALNAVRELLQGASFGFSDEIGAGMAAGMAAVADGADFGEAYQDIVGMLRQEQNQFREENPVLATGLQIAGGLGTGGLGLAKAGAALKGASAIPRVAGTAAIGATEGGIAGAGFSDENKAQGAAIGAATGAVIAPVVGEAVRKWANSSAAKKEIAQLIEKKSGDARTAKYLVAGAGKVKTDKVAKEAIKQGFDEGVIATIKGASETDKTKLRKMVSILERTMRDRREGLRIRPSDVAGESLAKRIQFIKQTNRQAGRQLDSVAESLKGKQVNYSGAIDSFLDDLRALDVTVNTKGGISVDLAGSMIEQAEDAKKPLELILKRLANTRTPDAYDVHRAKRFIDNMVTYGKGQDKGLKGEVLSAIKSLRRNLDSSLDEAFPEYNKVNTQYADTIKAIDAFQDAIGRKINLDSPNVDKALGTASRKLMSNYQTRVNLIDSLDDIDSVISKYGGKFDDDLLTQVLFFDELNAVFKPAARASFQGDISKEVMRGIRSGESLKEVAAEKVIDKVRNINEEQALKTIKELLSR